MNEPSQTFLLANGQPKECVNYGTGLEITHKFSGIFSVSTWRIWGVKEVRLAATS